jgi:putative ABC transport system permease protein
MKAIGYTPAQVSGILLTQVLLPVAIGAIAGVAVGTAASQPIVEQTARSFGLPASFAVSLPVVAAVLAITLATAALAATGPAIHAGRLSAVAAMTRGIAPSADANGGRLRRIGLRLPLRLPVRLGVAAGVAHPLRASMTLGALIVGVAALTFAIGMNWSLLRVMADLGRSEASPVRLELASPDANAAGITTALAGDPGTDRSIAIGQRDATVSPIGIVPFVGYDGDARWLGYALIQGRWFTSAGEAVAPTNFFRQTGLRLGDMVTVGRDGRTVSVRLVGEIFDAAEESRDNLVIRGTWADLKAIEPSIEPTRWEARPRSGVGTRTYRDSLQEALGGEAQVFVQDEGTSDESFLLFLTVIGVMGAVLVAISLGGVFNTVLLETRQRTREIAVLKAIGLTPAQVVAMVLASIVPIGIVAGLVGVPLGLVAQRAVLSYMGEVAAKTGIPPAIFDVFSPAMFVVLGLAGLAIGAAGAYLPAQRAARARIAPVLQAE